MEIVSNLLKKKTETAMTRKMLNNPKKRVMKMIIKTDAIYAGKLVVFCVVMAALKWHTLHALISRSLLKVIGIVLIVLKSSPGKEQLADKLQCSRVSNSRSAQDHLVDEKFLSNYQSKSKIMFILTHSFFI